MIGLLTEGEAPNRRGGLLTEGSGAPNRRGGLLTEGSVGGFACGKL